MLSSSNRITNNVIFYSILVSDFEAFDFKDDALAGVRANYFNSDCKPQKEFTEVEINSDLYNLSYNMNNSSPLSWKVTRNNRPYQSVKIETGGYYCVLYYSESGAIYKRVYFDDKHNWLRSEYFKNSDKPICSISQQLINDEVVLKLEKNLHSENKTSEILYSSKLQPEKECAALAYTNFGMMWFDASFNNQCEKNNLEEKTVQKRFNFTEKSFIPKKIGSFDITKADYLDESKLEAKNSTLESEIINQNKEPEIDETYKDAPSHGYSAYDMIQNILVEAHKTNKNLFGDVIEVQNALETERIDNNDDEYNLEVGGEQKNDTEVVTASGKYLYYGDLDENGNRHGKGRTVTPDGLTAYEGEYKDNLKDGFGVGYYKTGSINYVGNWSENKRSGAGVGYRLSDGTMHAGRWLENKPEGYGARFDNDGNLLDICNYDNGTRNGKSVSFDDNGNIIISVWQDGEKVFEKIIQDGDLIG